MKVKNTTQDLRVKKKINQRFKLDKRKKLILNYQNSQVAQLKK